MEVLGTCDACDASRLQWLIARLNCYSIKLGDLEPEFRHALLQDLQNLSALPAEDVATEASSTVEPITGFNRCRSFFKKCAGKVRNYVVNLWRCLPLQAEKLLVKVFVQLLILMGSISYAIDVTQNKYPKETFSGYVFVARLGGFACALETGVLYGSMARRWLSQLSCWVLPRHWSWCKAMLEAHQEIHVEAAAAMNFYGFLHVGCHLLGTIPALIQKSAEQLNQVIGCAQEDPPFWLDLSLEFLEWPPCPLDEDTKPQNLLEALFMTMPAVTGLLLIVLLFLVSITGYFRHEKSRGKTRCNFDYKWFQRVHIVTIWAWPVLLFLHGSQQWIGIGTPLVLFDLAVVAFCCGRFQQTQKCETTIKQVVVWQSPKGPSWVHIDCNLPEGCRFVPGMSVKIAFPRVSSERHSFSITTGAEKGVIGFTFQAVRREECPQAGDWCRKVIQRLADDVDDPERPLPSVSIYGGFLAAMQWALRRPVVVLIGLRRAMTPVISVGCALAAGHNDELVEAVCLLESYDKDHFTMHPELSQNANDQNGSQNVSVHLFLSAKKDAEDERFRRWLRRHSKAASLHTKLSPSRLAARPQVETDQKYMTVTLGSPDYAQYIGDLARRHPRLGVDVFVCGNPELQADVTKACQRCGEERPGQPIRLHME